MAFRLVVEYIPSSGSVSNIVDIPDCKYASFGGGLLDYYSENSDSDSKYLGEGYYMYDNSELSYMDWPEGWSSDVYIYKYDSKDDIPTSPSTPGGGTSQNTAWSATIEYYIDGEKTTFFQDQLAIENYPTSINNILNLSVEKYGTTGVIIHYKKSGSSTMEDYIITAPPGLNYSSISGASIGVEYNYLNKASVIKLYFTKNTSLTYNVNVSANPSTGGIVSKSPFSTPYNYADKVTIKATPKTGYKFNKWSINNLGNGTTTNVNTSSHTFYVINNYNCTAYFTPYTYNIIYKDKGNTTFSGNNSSSLPKTHTYGTTTTLVNGSKTGYKFEGWYTDSACESTALTSISNTYYTEDKSITLYAKWTIIEYTITYTNLNGATNPTSNPSKYTIETPTITFAKPTENLPEGFTWSKWNPSSITKGNTEKKTITAEWTTNKYTLTWNANGGTIPSTPSYTSGSVSYGTTITKPSNPTITGYSFTGWKDQTGSTTVATTMPAKDLTYTAQWSVNRYTINLNGGSSSQTSVKINYETSTFLNTSTGAVTTIIKPTKTGHTFRGWYTASGDNGSLIINTSGNLQANVKGYTNSSGQWIKAQDTTVYAYYTVNPYTITYKDQGGGTFSGSNLSSLPKTHTYGTATTLVNGSKTGYKFEGWYKDSACEGTAIKTLGATDYTSNITLFAKWTINTYTITYNLNGGTGTMTPTSYTVETATISLPTPTRTGYTFKGWYGNNQYSGSQITQISKGSTGNKQFWAKWEGNACTITVNANPSDLTSRLSGGGNYKNSDSITITAPSKYDVYKFENWTKNSSVVSTSPTYNFTANGNATYVANFIDNRKIAVFRIHVLDDTYVETSLCEVEIKYGDIDNPNQNSIKRVGNTDIEIDGPNSTISVIKTHISGTDILDKCGTLTSQVFYIFPTSINNEPFINILYNGNVVESEYLYTNTSETFDVYYGNIPSFSTPDEPGGDSATIPSEELKVRFNYWLEGVELEKGTATWESKWGEYTPPEEIETWWIQYNGFEQDKKDFSKNRINFTYHETGSYTDIANTPSQLQVKLKIEAPINCYVNEVTGVDTHDYSKEYNTLTNPKGLDVVIKYKNVTYSARATSNNTSMGSANVNGSGTNGSSNVDFIIGQQLKFNASPKTGYKFTKWVNQNNTSQVYTSNPYTIKSAPAADVHYEAYFGPEEYTIILDPNGGSGSQTSVKIDYLSSSLKSTITNPTRTGYTFNGWYTGASDGSPVIGIDGKLKPSVSGYTNSSSQWTKTGGATLYAHWTAEEYTITLNSNGGSGSQSSVKVDYLSSSLKSTITNPTRTGYTFNGWYTTASGGSLVISTDGKLQPKVRGYTNSSSQWTKTGGATLYAKWTANKWTLTWDLNGGTVKTAGTCAPLNSTGAPSGKVDYLSDITAPIVSKNGYKFEGWSVNGVDAITPASKMPDGDLKYIAVYSINTYNITVNDNLSLGKVYIKVNGVNEGVTTTCKTGETITLVAENTIEYVLSSWKKSGGSDISDLNEFTFTAPGTYLDNTIENNIFTAYYKEDPKATLKINFIVDDIIEKTAIFKFNTTFSFLGDSTTKGYRCEIQGEPQCLEGDIDINQQGYFFIPSKYNGEDICMVPYEQGSGTTVLICSNKGTTIGYDGWGSQYYLDNTTKNNYCPTRSGWQAYLPTNVADKTHLVFPAVEKEEYGILYGPLVIDVYYGKIPERFLPVIPDNVEITTVSGLKLLQRIQNKIATFKWLNNLFGEPEKTAWDSYDNSGLKSFLKDDSKETPLSMHCIEYGDLQIYNQDMDDENINGDKTIKQYSFTSDATIIKPLNGQVVLDVSKIEGNKIYFNITNLSSFANTDNGIYIYFSVNNETDENNATLYKMKLPKTPSNKGLLLTIPDVSNIESLYIYRTPIMVDSTKTGITPKILFSSEKDKLSISVYDRTTLNTVI